MTRSSRFGARTSRRLLRTGSRLVRTLDIRESSWARPLPNVRIQTGPWVPALALHFMAAAVALACVSSVTESRTQWIIPSVLVMLTLLRPAGAPPALLALWFGLQVTTADISVHTLKASGLVFGFHLFATLLITAGEVNPRTRIELRVFAGPLRRLGTIQALVQPVTWATMTLDARDFTLPWLTVSAAVAVVFASWVLVRRVAETPHRNPPPRNR